MKDITQSEMTIDIKFGIWELKTILIMINRYLKSIGGLDAPTKIALRNELRAILQERGIETDGLN